MAGAAARRSGGPRHGGLALVGDADGGDLAGFDAAVAQHLARAGELAVPDVERVVLDPAGLGEMLGIFLLGAVANTCPWRSNRMARELVVPWSRARMYSIVVTENYV
jgi:hypothetical protein